MTDSELTKCLKGEFFICNDPELSSIIAKARRLTERYNGTPFAETEKRTDLLRQLFGSMGRNVVVDKPFYCDYGRNIHIGDDCIINMNCTFVDCNRIDIGNKVLIASNVQIYTATHPADAGERLVQDWDEESGTPWFKTFAQPVRIEDNVWIGGGVIILPGVTIGNNSVIGAGSVVTRSIPPDSVAVGNPCKVIRRQGTAQG